MSQYLASVTAALWIVSHSGRADTVVTEDVFDHSWPRILEISLHIPRMKATKDLKLCGSASAGKVLRLLSGTYDHHFLNKEWKKISKPRSGLGTGSTGTSSVIPFRSHPGWRYDQGQKIRNNEIEWRVRQAITFR